MQDNNPANNHQYYRPPFQAGPPAPHQPVYYGGPPPGGPNYYAYGYPPQQQPPANAAGGYPPQQYQHPPPAYAGYPQQQQQQQPPAGYYGGYQPYAAPDSPMDDNIPPEKLLHGDLDVSIRHAFIRKVYSILFVQLAITFGFASICSLVPAVSDWMVGHYYLAYLGMAISMALVCGMSCFPEALARKYPTNMICLTGISLGFSLFMGVMAAVVSPAIFLGALATTAAVVLALTLFAFQTKWDFTGCGPFVMVTAVVLMIFGIVNIFVRNRVVHLIYASLGALLFSFYLVYDTQQVVGGKHRKFQYSIDDYTFAVMTLYLDIINLFLYILMLFSAASEDR